MVGINNYRWLLRYMRMNITFYTEFKKCNLSWVWVIRRTNFLKFCYSSSVDVVMVDMFWTWHCIFLLYCIFLEKWKLYNLIILNNFHYFFPWQECKIIIDIMQDIFLSSLKDDSNVILWNYVQMCTVIFYINITIKSSG